ncbi:MAG: nitroreductase family protein [Puniceicoccales bacterium]|jgi:nitroreductase|nr:nitroreductase family protein [Puniceicoccales bacterium]
MDIKICLFVLNLLCLSQIADACNLTLLKKHDDVILENKKKFNYVGLMDAILNRRSIRSYTSEPITSEQITMILKAGFAAPSAMGSSPWHFIAIKDRVVLDKLEKVHPYAGMLKSAPFAVLVCGDKSLESIPDKFEQNCSAAAENILIAATALGLGSVWVGVYPDEPLMKKFREVLNIPEKVFPFALIPIGHPTKTPSPSERYNSERVHIDRW